MSGHSKWASIKHKKGALDAKRGRRFTKLIKEITVAARAGGGDPDHNAKLRQLMDKAKSINMPQENATRAIKKGTGELPGVNYEQCVYEGYGPHSIAVLVEVLTDNRNKTVAELRHLFSKKGGTLAESGAVSWMFEKKGVVKGPAQDMTEDKLLEHLLEFDIADIFIDGDIFIIHCAPTELETLKKAVAQLNLTVETADLEWVPKNTVNVSDEQSTTALDFLNSLEDLDDVQNVYTNLG